MNVKEWLELCALMTWRRPVPGIDTRARPTPGALLITTTSTLSLMSSAHSTCCGQTRSHAPLNFSAEEVSC